MDWRAEMVTLEWKVAVIMKLRVQPDFRDQIFSFI